PRWIVLRNSVLLHSQPCRFQHPSLPAQSPTTRSWSPRSRWLQRPKLVTDSTLRSGSLFCSSVNSRVRVYVVCSVPLDAAWRKSGFSFVAPSTQLLLDRIIGPRDDTLKTHATKHPNPWPKAIQRAMKGIGSLTSLLLAAALPPKPPTWRFPASKRIDGLFGRFV